MKNQPYTTGSYKLTKDNPFINRFENRRSRRANTIGREFSNKKGIQMVVTKTGTYSFDKYKKIISETNDMKINGRGNLVFKQVCHLANC